MFNIYEYKNYVKSQIIGRAVYLKIDITDQLISALFQFEQPPSKFLSHIPNNRISEKYKTIFDLSDKTNSSFMNNWMLFKFGYKHCSKCFTVKLLEEFSVDNNRWDLTTAYCSCCMNATSYKWNADNPEKRKEIEHTYRKANREAYRRAGRKYRINNLDKDAAKTAKRRAAKLLATPRWLTAEHYNEIALLYTKAKQLEAVTDIKYHIDHIIPLRGANVCGLHVPWNLQIITAEENIRKHNKCLN